MDEFWNSMSKKDQQGVMLALGVAVIVMLIFVAAAWPKPAYDKVTLCPETEPYGRTAVLVDASDPLSSSQRTAIHEGLTHLKASLARYERMIIAVYREGAAPEIVFDMCNPGSGKDASPLYETPTRVQRVYEEKFDRPLNEVLERMLAANTAPQSPILEMIQDISTLYQFDPSAPHRRLVVISDMLQNTPRLSHYRTKPNYAAFVNSDYANSVMADLDKVVVTVFYVSRPGSEKFQNNNHTDFWIRYFKDAGANGNEIRRIR